MDEYDDTYMYDDDDDEAENDVYDDDGQCIALEEESDEERMTYSNRKQNYNILNKEEIRRNMDEDIAILSTLLSVSAAESSVLLRHNGWNVSNVSDAWFADEFKVRERVGLIEVNSNTILDDDNQIATDLTCGICFQTYPRDNFKSVSCGHYYCVECWLGYITTSINSDGPGCLGLRCPAYKCKVSVRQEIIESLASDDDKRKYTNYLIASYVEQSQGEKKQCPAPDCEFVIQFHELGEGENLDVTCACNYRFCFNCREESHRPATCESVGKWLLKNSSESENVNYIIAFTKPCPKCKRPIEKWEGCMHMTCRCCRQEFCWLCLNVWSGHNGNACNKFKTSNDEDSMKRVRAKDYLQKYVHHFERWLANQKSSEKALEDLECVKEVDLKKLSVTQGVPDGLLYGIVEAWEQIIECRKLLRWTYVYGYYLDGKGAAAARKDFFEYLQGEAEVALEKLHTCTKKDIQCFIDAEGPSEKFKDYRSKLVSLTAVTKKYFEKLMTAMENNLSDVESIVYKD